MSTRESTQITRVLHGTTSEYPADLLVALICERLHALPAQILQHDYFTLMRTWNLLNEVDRIRSPKGKRKK